MWGLRLVLRAYIAAVVVMSMMDLLWLGVAAKGLYRRSLRHLLASDVRWGAVILFYFIYAAGVTYFAALPGIEAASLRRAAAHGAALGLLVYATYDLTNLALLRGWPVGISIIDILWGGVITSTVAAAAFWAGKNS